MRELRIHGRGGQGTVIASKLLAVARAFQDATGYHLERPPLK